MGHEIVHVIARHSAQQIAQAQLAQGLTGALVMATYDPENPASMGTAQVAMLISQLVTMKFGREDEIQSDELGVRVMAENRLRSTFDDLGNAETGANQRRCKSG